MRKSALGKLEEGTDGVANSQPVKAKWARASGSLDSDAVSIIYFISISRKYITTN
jgi:hypothetical protein